MRLFVAIELPDAWRDVATRTRQRLEERLPDPAAQALRWVAPELLHLTLRFVGEYPDDEVERLQGYIESGLESDLQSVAVELQLDGLGTFGTPPRTSALWLEVAGNRAGLEALAVSVELAVTSAGVQPERRPFSPHITLARVRERVSEAARRAIAAAAAEADRPQVPPVVVREVALVRSHLNAGGPRYDVLSRHPRRTPRGSAVDSEEERNLDALRPQD